MGRGIGTWSGVAMTLLSVGLGGCGGAHGFAWSVTLEMFEDECNDPAVPYTERLQYLLDFVGSDVVIALGEAPWGTGTLSGCSLVYESPVWVEDHDGHAVSWKIDGDALIREGGTSCGLESGVDWQGIETITIESSDDPAVPVGCRYYMTSTGVYKGEQ